MTSLQRSSGRKKGKVLSSAFLVNAHATSHQPRDISVIRPLQHGARYHILAAISVTTWGGILPCTKEALLSLTEALPSAHQQSILTVGRPIGSLVSGIYRMVLTNPGVMSPVIHPFRMMSIVIGLLVLYIKLQCDPHSL